MIRWFKRKDKATGEIEEVSPGRLEEAGEAPVEELPEAAREGVPVPEEEPPETQAALESQEPHPEDREDSPSDAEPMDPGERKGGFFRELRARLHKTREQLIHRVDRIVFGKKTIDMELLDELEEVLITSDLGVHTTQLLLNRVTEKIRRQELKDPAKLRESLQDAIGSILAVPAGELDFRSARPFVVMVIGVNGVGKTTTIGKLAQQLKNDGLKVMLAAADTFRAAAIEQLTRWGERVGVPVIHQKSGSDPSAVAFDAMEAAAARDCDVLILDTAGRMHTKVNLMEELKKVQRVLSKKMPGAPHEVLLVLDASTGQNALSQARQFQEGIGVTGLVLTKLDGTAKGGIIVAICDELRIPVRYIGIGERLEDLRPFDPDVFTRALF